MVTLTGIMAVVAGTGGAIAMYLASPNQKLCGQPLALRTGLFTGCLGLAVSVSAFRRIAGPATSIYLCLTLVMFVWAVVPLAAGWWRHRTEPRT